MESSSSDEKDKLNRILRKLNFIASVLSSIRRCIQKYAQLKLKFKIRKPIDHANAGMIKYPIEKNVGKKKKKANGSYHIIFPWFYLFMYKHVSISL